MTSFRIRPRFRFTSPSCPEKIKEEMKEKLTSHHHQFTSKSLQGHLIVAVKKEDRHYWSPQLDVVFEKLPEGNTLIRGLYGPNPSVWTLFTFLYSVVVLSILFLLIYEGAQYSLGIIMSFSWSIPFLLGIGILLYIVSQVGQKLGAAQTFALHHFLEDTLHAHIDID
jgi:hypothetical protein